MAFPIFAVLGVITLAATTAAWLFDKRTEEEKKRQQDIEEEYETLNREYSDLSATLSPENQVRSSSWWERRLKITTNELSLLEGKCGPIRDDLARNKPLLIREAQNPSADHFRRNMLKRELVRFEEAEKKLDAYSEYIAWYRDKITRIVEKRDLQDLNDMPRLSALLPEHWLYVGKIVLLPRNMLGKPLPEFGHQINLSEFPSLQIQRTYFDRENQETSPLLIVNRKTGWNDRFFGCSIRGRFYIDNILGKDSAKFKIEYIYPQYYLGSMIENQCRAILPKENLLYSNLEKKPGDVLDVYPEEFNLMLDGNYTGRYALNGKTSPIVTERPISQADVAKTVPLFLLMDSSKYDAQICMALDAANEPFYLLTVPNRDNPNQILLAKGGLKIVCNIEPEGWLKVADIKEEESFLEEGIELPILIIPAEHKSKRNLSPNPAAIIDVCEYVNRLENSHERTQRAEAANDFFDKWMQILDFLQKERGEGIYEFSAIIEDITVTDEIYIKLPELDKSRADSAKFWEMWNETEFGTKRFAYLFIWIENGSGDGIWLKIAQSAEKASSGWQFVIDKNDARNINFGKENLYRVSFRTSQYTPLERGKNALNALKDEAFVNNQVRDALILPEERFYKPHISDTWKKRLLGEDIWLSIPTPLSANQKDVVRKCLTVSPLVQVQGPPGAGKTRCILEIIVQFLSYHPDAKILVASQQNAAVDNVFERLDQNFKDVFHKHSISLMRIGNEDKMSDISKLYSQDRKMDDFISLLSSYSKNDEIREEDQIYERLSKHYKSKRENQQPENQNQGLRIDNETLYCMTAGCQIIGATCIGLASRSSAVSQCQFDLVIIDEAGRATPPELLVPMRLGKKVILIGDHFQLPPTVDHLLREDETEDILPFLKEEFLEKSFFEKLFDSMPDEAKCRLTDQFRMDNLIGDLVAKLFYTFGGERFLFNGAPDKEEGFIYWRNCVGRHKRTGGTSLSNEEEAQMIFKTMELIDKSNVKSRAYNSIAVITPYSAQKRLLNNMMKQKIEDSLAMGRPLYISIDPENIRIDTVDSFQGSEADVVIYSTVRSKGPISFLLDKKRLNVACSRAKKALIFVGNKKLFSQDTPGGENYFAKIIRFIDDRKS